MTPDGVLEHIKATHGEATREACQILYDLYCVEALLIDRARTAGADIAELETKQVENVGRITTLVASRLGLQPAVLAGLLETLDASVKLGA